MQKKLLIIGLVVAVVVVGALAFVAKNASKLIKEKIETSMGKDVTVQDISLSWGGVDVSGVKIMKDGIVTVKADRIGIKADFLGFLKKGYALSSLTLDKPFIRLQIDRNGEFVNPVPSSGADQKKKDGKGDGKEADVAFSIGEIVIRDGEIQYQDDRRPVPMNTIGIKNLNLSLDGVAWPLADKNSRLEVAALLEGKLIAGTIRTKGDLNLKTKAIKLQGEGQNVVLLDLKDKGPFAKSENVALAVASSGSQYTFSDLTLKKPFLRVDADSQGKFINPFDAIAPAEQKSSSKAKSAQTAEAKPEKADDLAVAIQKMQVTDGTLDYYNGKVSSPPHRTRLEAVQFSMDNIAVPMSDKTSNYSFSANCASGTIVSKGTTVLKSKDTKSVVTVRNLDITQFKPYFQKKGDAAVTRGAMNLDLDLNIKSKMINSPGKVVLKNLEFASGSGLGGQVMGVPRAAVVNLMKSSNNEIALDFTLQGNIDDPQFSIREGIMKKLTAGLAEKLGASVSGIGSAIIGGGKEGVGQIGKGASSVGGGLKKLFGK